MRSGKGSLQIGPKQETKMGERHTLNPNYHNRSGERSWCLVGYIGSFVVFVLAWNGPFFNHSFHFAIQIG